jgi:hypothetical protein
MMKLKWRISTRVATAGFLTPGMGLLAIFVVFPILLTAWMSLHSGSMITSYSDMPWVGLKNYAIIFQQPTFRTALLNTFLYSLVSLLIIVPLSVILGIFLYQSTIRGRGVLSGATSMRRNMDRSIKFSAGSIFPRRTGSPRCIRRCSLSSSSTSGKHWAIMSCWSSRD